MSFDWSQKAMTDGITWELVFVWENRWLPLRNVNMAAASEIVCCHGSFKRCHSSSLFQRHLPLRSRPEKETTPASMVGNHRGKKMNASLEKMRSLLVRESWIKMRSFHWRPRCSAIKMGSVVFLRITIHSTWHPYGFLTENPYQKFGCSLSNPHN